MKKTNCSVQHEEDGVTTEERLLTYSEDERQQQEINSANAALVFSPKFIPFYPALQQQYNLTNTEVLIFGFIDFYKSNSPGRFYFNNEQIGKIVNCAPDSVSRCISHLEDLRLLKTSKRVRSGGGTIRFVTDIFYKSELTISTSQNRQNIGLYINKNKIKENKIKNIGTTYLYGASTETDTKKTYGHEKTNLILDSFKEKLGRIPADHSPRNVAYNIAQIISTFIRKHQDTYKQQKGGELSFAYVLSRCWDYYLRKDYAMETEKLEPFKARVKVFLAAMADRLQKHDGTTHYDSETTGRTDRTDQPVQGDPADQALAPMEPSLPRGAADHTAGLGGLLRKMP